MIPDPTWLGYVFAALVSVVGIYSLARVVSATTLGRQDHHLDVNIAHMLMAFAMVGMLVPGWSVLPVGLWLVVFAALALWFLVKAVRLVAGHGLASVTTGVELAFGTISSTW